SSCSFDSTQGGKDFGVMEKAEGRSRYTPCIVSVCVVVASSACALALAARGRNPKSENRLKNSKESAYVSAGFVPFCHGQLDPSLDVSRYTQTSCKMRAGRGAVRAPRPLCQRSP